MTLKHSVCNAHVKIKRLSIIFEDKNGELFEAFVEGDFSKQLWTALWSKNYLALSRWDEQKIEVEKK